ncbi:hypothetical protein BDN72DRAFT_954023 [Pluteus cervinus]|uniref:Uncharacterized protein n=1 Tax=Pluteus cervinus TaxID=181527 RepID=A0ACD3BF08_9AGAR|nr:hypothetical protein BDN72DRAFT_954023 [Pluteus cervinus]
MPHSPRKPPPRQQPRRVARSAVQSRLGKAGENENSDEDDLQEEEAWEAVKRPVAKSAGRPATFKSQKQNLYAEFRKQSKDILRGGNEHIDQPLAKIQELKAKEVPYMNNLEELKAMIKAEESTVVGLLSAYPKVIDDLSTCRSERVDCASKMLLDNPARRQREMALFLKNARKLLDQFRQGEKVAGDASAYIRHYKSLLRA